MEKRGVKPRSALWMAWTLLLPTIMLTWGLSMMIWPSLFSTPKGPPPSPQEKRDFMESLAKNFGLFPAGIALTLLSSAVFWLILKPRRPGDHSDLFR